MRALQTFVHIPQSSDVARGIMTNKCTNNMRRLWHNLSNILKLNAAFWYSIYHQQDIVDVLAPK